MTDKNEWEKIIDTNMSFLRRVKVPGGYLYKNVSARGEISTNESMCFVPDPKQCWNCSHDTIVICPKCESTN
jgi:hypothetical protein